MPDHVLIGRTYPLCITRSHQLFPFWRAAGQDCDQQMAYTPVQPVHLAAGVSVSQPAPSEEHQSHTLLKTLSSKLMRSMRRSSSDQSMQLSTQMSNLGPARQEGESAGAAAMHVILFLQNMTALIYVRLSTC